MKLAALALLPLLGSAPDPSVEILPARARPGDALLVLVRGGVAPPTAAVAGRALSFHQVPEGFVAVAGLPVETPPGPLAVAVTLPAAAGAASSLVAAVEVEESGFTRRELSVDRRFVAPPPPEIQRRIEEDRAAFALAFAQPAAPPLFADPFAWPRRDRVTARFGEQRTFNGVKPSQHYGVDLAGKVGAPVAASNAGEVVLARDCWASGKTVVLWHGAGLYTTYAHLSRILVAAGAHVGRGEIIGRVGKSGRVSGPHLHWSVKVGDLYVDPESVLRLPLGRRLEAPLTRRARAEASDGLTGSRGAPSPRPAPP